MSRSMVLCEWCALIPFDPDILTSRKNSETYYLGSGARLGGSQCPFCRLVVSVFSECREDVNKYLHVHAKWILGFSNRWFFDVLDAGETYIGFGRIAADRQLEDTKTNRTYFVEPSTESVLDSTRVLRWISSCENMHGPVCGLQPHPAFAEAFRGLYFLRLIDVETDCLVEKRNLERYVALSYVWGAVSNFRLTKANRAALLTPGSLKKVSNLLPKTIKDTITLVRRLGVRFLWVDALCLLQNDAEDLEQGVNAMDLIYELAWLTVVAGCGHDANSRLPGVQNGTRRASRNTVEVKPGVEMGIVTGLDTLLKDSVYNSRAWTFQEQVLSRRVIYFVGNKVFYRCRVAEHSENFADILSNNSVGITVGSLLPEAILMKNPMIDYSTMLLYYTQRALTDQNDAPRAMAGIIRRFTNVMKCRFLEGLPTALFDQFILFYANKNILHRRSSFPSYSWIGWRGGIDVHDDPGGLGSDVNNWLRKKTWIIWYKRNPSGLTNLVWDPSANDSFPSQDMTYLGYRDRSRFSDGRQTSKQLDTRRTMPTEEVSFSRVTPVYPLLQFWTISVFYNITNIDVFEATGYLTDLDNVQCGFALLDGFEETTFFESKGPFEVILLSESCILGLNRYSVKFDSHSKRRYSNASDQTYYNVLLLEWRGGIAERRGFGHIFQDAVDNSLAPGPVWKEIFLA